MKPNNKVVKIVKPGSLQRREQAVARQENRVKKQLRDLVRFSQIPALQLSQRGGFQQRRKLKTGKIQEVAERLGMDSSELNATKRLFDIKHPKIKEVNAAIADMTNFFMSGTLPYVIQRGVRLFKFRDPTEQEIRACMALPREKPMTEDQARQSLILDQLVVFKQELSARIREAENAVTRFNQESFHEVLAERRARLGNEFDPEDYGVGIKLYVVLREVSIAPPSYMSATHPELRRQALNQMKKDYEDATHALIDATVTQFQTSLVKLHERLTGRDENGERKQFREGTVLVFQDAIKEFHASIKAIGATNPKLDECVQGMADMLKGVSPSSLRDNDSVRQKVSEQSKQIFEKLNDALVSRPPRRINDDLQKLLELRKKEEIE